MPPAIIDAANAHRAALLAREQATMQGMARQWLQVESALSTATENLAFQMAQSDVTTMGQLARMERYRQLRGQVADELRKYNGYADDTIAAGQRSMITDALTHSATAINTVAVEAQAIVQWNRLPVSAVERLAGLAGDGSPLRAILEEATRGAGDRLAEHLVAGIALGKNPVEVARQALRMGLGQSFTRIQNISRTEMLRAYRVTTLEQYASSRVVKSYRRLSARDDRVCAGCLFADGQEYPIDYGFDSHVNCRCTTLPVLANVPFPAYQDGQSWFTSQPEATQRSILGKGRYEAWRDGRASLDDLVTRQWDATWGGALVPTLVRNLPR